MTIEKLLTDLIDMESADVNLKDKFIKISYDNDTLNLETIKSIIEEVEYEIA